MEWKMLVLRGCWFTGGGSVSFIMRIKKGQALKEKLGE